MTAPPVPIALQEGDPAPPQLGSGNRTKSGGFSTNDGTVYVSKPYRSKGTKNLKALISFTPRKSHFDTTNELSGSNEFRGFFSLFWISMFLFVVRTYVVSLETTGSVLNLRFASMFSKDAVTLAISDAVLVGSTAICVPFAKAVSRGWIRYSPYGIILQHLIQTLILLTAISWTFNRQWPWVQSGFLTLHSLVMIMKMHSYITVNGHFAETHARAAKVMMGLRQSALESGGWNQAISLAKARRDKPSYQTGFGTDDEHSDQPTAGSAGSSTPEVKDETSYHVVTDLNTASVLRHRLNSVSAKGTAVEGAKIMNMAEEVKKWPPHVLVYHPDPKVSSVAQEYSDLQAELTSSGTFPVRWPENITYKNFAVYQLIPTLVYELEYPRTDRIRPLFLFEKTVAFMGTFALLYTVTETFILPLTPNPNQSFLRSLLDLALPFMISYILLFYIIFECICNGFAEIAYFADRQFYEDWWNSTSMEEFSRKWNKPVHTFLLRHVYAPVISAKASKNTAMLVTFGLSALAHELVMTVVTKKIRMYLFLMQLVQIPLIAVSRLPAIKRNKLLGNVVFWLGLYAGFPLLCVAYVAY